MTEIDFDKLQPLRLSRGSHEPGSGKGCAMNVISYITGEARITDYPECADRGLAKIVQAVNDALADPETGMLSPEDAVAVVDLGMMTIGTAAAPGVTSALQHSIKASLFRTTRISEELQWLIEAASRKQYYQVSKQKEVVTQWKMVPEPLSIKDFSIDGPTTVTDLKVKQVPAKSEITWESRLEPTGYTLSRFERRQLLSTACQAIELFRQVFELGEYQGESVAEQMTEKLVTADA